MTWFLAYLLVGMAFEYFSSKVQKTRRGYPAPVEMIAMVVLWLTWPVLLVMAVVTIRKSGRKGK